MMTSHGFASMVTVNIAQTLRNQSVVANIGRKDKMKIHEVIRLRNIYGGKRTLDDLVKLIQGNKIYECPKCGGRGVFTKRVNFAQYWECCENYKEVEIPCDLCNGEGYTEKEYKPKMVQDGWECK